MTPSNILMIVAIVIAPFAAVFAQRQVELWRERRRRKLDVFKTLMSTRSRNLSPEHVQALNMIELEFTDRSDDDVRKAWRVYRDHLNTPPKGDPPSEAAVENWVQRSQDNLAALLDRMGESLGYKFDPVQITKGAYAPQAHAEAEIELQLLRRALLAWLTGGHGVSVSVVPVDEGAAKRGEEFTNGLLALLKGDGRIKVEVEPHKPGEETTVDDSPERNVDAESSSGNVAGRTT